MDEAKRPTTEHAAVEVNRDDVSILTFTIEGEEMLKIAPEGFEVRGRPVDVGDVAEHDRAVYRAMRAFLASVVQKRGRPLRELVIELLDTTVKFTAGGDFNYEGEATVRELLRGDRFMGFPRAAVLDEVLESIGGSE